MGKKSSLSDVQRAQIVVLYKEEYFERSISERMKKSKNAVYDAVVKLRKQGLIQIPNGLVVHKKPRQGMTTALGRRAVQSPMSSASKHTVRTACKRCGH